MATNPRFSLQQWSATNLTRVYYVMHDMTPDEVEEAMEDELIDGIRSDLHLPDTATRNDIKKKLIPRLIRRLRKMNYTGSYTYDDIMNFIFVHRPPRPPAPYTPPPTPHITTIGDDPEDVRQRLRPRPFPLDPPSPPRPLPRYIDSNEYKERQLRKRIDRYRQRQGRLKRTLSSDDLHETHRRHHHQRHAADTTNVKYTFDFINPNREAIRYISRHRSTPTHRLDVNEEEVITVNEAHDVEGLLQLLSTV